MNPGIRIAAMARRSFPDPPAIAGRPGQPAHLRSYLTDLVRPYRLALCEEALADHAGHSYGEMAAAILADLVPPDQPLDLVVLAFAVPDVRPGRATATYLGQLRPGNPLSFAICDQGVAAGFTGLRLVNEYAAAQRRRALLLIVEQAAVPYHSGAAVETPAAHTAVGLHCDGTGPAEVTSVRQHAGVAPERVAGLLAEAITAAAADGKQVSVVVEAHLADRIDRPPAGCQVRVAPTGHLHTGGWWELAGMLTDQPAGGRTLLAAYDRDLHYLCLLTIDVRPDGKGATP